MGGGVLEKRPYLVNFVFLGKKDGCIGICNHYILNKILYGQ